MEAGEIVNSTKTEKANALARYRKHTNISKLLQVMEVFLAVSLISFCLPTVFKFSEEYVFAFSSYLMNQHVVFLVGNVIVGICYILSRYTFAGIESSEYGIHYDDDKHGYSTHHRTTPDDLNFKPYRVTESSPESQNSMILNENSMIVTESEVKAETEIKQSTKEIKGVERTKSDDLKRRKSMKACRELQRSVTEMRRRMDVDSGGETSTVKSFQAVEKLSDEEFRIVVETFILQRQRSLKRQSMVEDDG